MHWYIYNLSCVYYKSTIVPALFVCKHYRCQYLHSYCNTHDMFANIILLHDMFASITGANITSFRMMNSWRTCRPAMVSALRATCRGVTLGMAETWCAKKWIYIKLQRLWITWNNMNKCIQSIYLDWKERTKWPIPG